MTPQDAEAKAREIVVKWNKKWSVIADDTEWTDKLTNPLIRAIAAALLAAANDKWNYGHHKPGTVDYFHNYGDCGGSLETGCGFRARGGNK